MRTAIGVIVGAIIGFTIFKVVQQFGHSFYPPPVNLDPTDIDSIRSYLANAPVGALLIVVASYLVGTAIAAFTAVKIAANEKMAPAYIVGGVIGAVGLINFISMPHPAWMVAASYVGYAIGAFAGGMLAGGKLPGSGLAGTNGPGMESLHTDQSGDLNG